MRFTIRNTSRENLISLMRRAGYHFIGQDVERSEFSFVRPIGVSYPRFHIYVKQDQDNLIFNLHLDQKKPIYRGATAHSGDYEGPVVEEEVQRIKQILN